MSMLQSYCSDNQKFKSYCKAHLIPCSCSSPYQHLEHDKPMMIPSTNLNPESQPKYQNEIKAFLRQLLIRQTDIATSISEVHWYSKHYLELYRGREGRFDDILWSSSNGKYILQECIQILQFSFDSDIWGTGLTIEKDFIINTLFEKDNTGFKRNYEHLETSQIVGITRIIQLLLHKGVQLFQSQQSNDVDQNANSLNASMAINIAGTLINNLTKKLCDAIKYIDRSNNDFINEIAQLYLTILAKPINQIACKTKILANVWRSICDISVTLNKSRMKIEKSILSHIIRVLTQYLEEGNKFLLQIISNLKSALLSQNNITCCSDIVNTPAMQQLTKLHKFFLLRLHQIITITTEGYKSDYIDSNTHILNHLIHFKGLTLMICILSEQLVDIQKNEWERQIQPMFQILPKVDQSVEKLLFLPSSSGNDRIINQLNVSICLSMDCPHENKVPDQNGIVMSQYYYLTNGFWLGKLHVLTKTLKMILNTMTMKDDNDNMDQLLSICERLLYQILPRCHGWLTIQSSSSSAHDGSHQFATNANLISETVHAITDCVIFLKRSDNAANSSKYTSKVDLKLIHWLSPYPISVNKVNSLSFSQELVFIILHSYIIRLVVYHKKKHSLSIIRILGKLVFDPRTETYLRTSICTLLFRLLTVCHSLSGIDVKHKNSLMWVVQQTEIVLSKQFQLFLLGMFGGKRDKRGRKRQYDYSFSTIFIAFEGFEVIIPLVELLSTCESFWSVQDKNLVTLFLRVIQLKDCKDQSLRLLFDDNPWLVHLVLIILKGALLTKQNSKMNLKIETLQEFIMSGVASLYSNKECSQHYVLSSTLVECLDVIIAISTKGFQSNLWLSFGNFLSYFSIQNGHDNRSAIRTKFLISKLLSIVAFAITNDIPEQLLSAVSATFITLFNSPERSLQILAMLAMEKFATTLHTNHRLILPKCVPQQVQSLLQCRLRGFVYDFSTSTMSNEKNLYFHDRIQESIILDNTNEYLNMGSESKLCYPLCSKLQINSGAKVMWLCSKEQNKTQDVIVIFTSNSLLPVDKLTSLKVSKVGSIM